MRDYFMKTARIGFSRWGYEDLDLALSLWGDEEVTRLICASGRFTVRETEDRLQTEISNQERYQIQYWPIFELATGELVGCCGIRPFRTQPLTYELGFHLRRSYWGMGYAGEAAERVITYSFEELMADRLYAGHHPENLASAKRLVKLGFRYIGNNYYEPTGLWHPSYELLPGDGV